MGSRRNPNENLDRFIPNRSAMDFNFARSMLSGAKLGKENCDILSPASEAYQNMLIEALGMNRTRILEFKNKAPIPRPLLLPPINCPKPLRHIPQSPTIVLDAPNVQDNDGVNILDWGVNNTIAIALDNTVYLWDVAKRSPIELLTMDEKEGPITSLSWAPDANHVAIGLHNSKVQLWDLMKIRLERILMGGHNGFISLLAWNDRTLTTAGKDGKIIDNDVRMKSPVVSTYKGHQQVVCGLKWSSSGQQLASGGTDKKICIWDRTMGRSFTPSTRWLHRFQDHTDLVRALAWCPFQSHLLASGGGKGDGCIMFWDTQKGTRVNIKNTGSEVGALLWSKKEQELLSSHGSPQNQLTLWRYPALTKMAELTGHTSRVLTMVQSPEGCTVASVTADETLRLWEVFGAPDLAKRVPKAAPFAKFNCTIR